MYCNLIGCDVDRVYYDGCCMIAMNGEVLVQVGSKDKDSHCIITIISLHETLYLCIGLCTCI